MNPLIRAIAVVAFGLLAAAQTPRAGNPVIDGWYADPEAHVFDGQYWIYPTYSAPYGEQTFLDAFSSPDLVTWSKHPRVLEIARVKWATRAVWAPSIVLRDGWYYLFFGANDIQNDTQAGGIGIAKSRSPQGPFEDHLGRPLVDKFHNGAQPIDPFVFKDDDGAYYLIYGGWRHCNIAKLNADFTGFVPFADGTTFKEITPAGYVEGSFMFKKDGKYYFMWSEGGWTGPNYAVAYAIGTSPLGPFERVGKILQQDPAVATGAGHHSILQSPRSGKWYIVYHRRPLGETDRNHRVVCIDEMKFDATGAILPVVITKEGVARDPAQQTAPPPTPPAGRGGVLAQGAEADIPLVAKFDTDGNRRLDHAERVAAREYLAAHPELRRPARGPSTTRRGTPGLKLTPKDVASLGASVPLYDAGTLRTVFLQFDHEDWEQELGAFWHTDVEVAATVVVDGKTYRDVGVSFRGNNSFTSVPDSLKRSLTLSFDFVDANQRLLGYRTVHLLNGSTDPTLLRSVLYLDVARDYMPTLKANFMRVAINGESWGVYTNQQAFNKDFLLDTYRTTAGVQWKSPNNSVGGGLSYLGEDVAPYRRWYEMKGNDDLAGWAALVRVCRVLNQTPPAALEQALAPIMDVNGALRFLAIDATLINNDGYWNDGSDFNVYIDAKGLLHLTTHDANEGFRAGGRGGAQLDPLTATDDPNKALRQKLLAAPALRTRYLAYTGEIADKWLDWNRLGPLVDRYRKLIADDVAKDTRKLDPTEAFTTGVFGDGTSPPGPSTLRGFADQRRTFLLAHPEIVKARGR